MEKKKKNGEGRKNEIGRRILIIMIVEIMIVIEIVWMRIYIFDKDGGINFDDIGIFDYDLNELIEWVESIWLIGRESC